MNRLKMDEEWRDIEGYEGYYQVSDLGRVRSLDRVISNGKGTRVTKGVVMKGLDNGNGYLGVCLQRGGISLRKYIHRLVSEVFIPNPSKLLEVNHKDENKGNNSTRNLEWCNRQYNLEYSIKRQYEVLNPNGFLVDVFNMAKFCKENNLDASCMLKVAKGVRKQHMGYKAWLKG